MDTNYKEESLVGLEFTSEQIGVVMLISLLVLFVGFILGVSAVPTK